MIFFRRSHSPKRPAFHPETTIRDLGDGDAYQLADAQTGTIIVGSTGGGKTTGPGRFLAYGFMANQFGGLVLCAKKEECRQWQKWAAECGREDDLVIVNADGDRRYNFMEDEASRPGEGGGFIINIVAQLDEIAGAIAGGGKGDGGGENKVWEDALHTLNSHAVGHLCAACGFDFAAVYGSLGKDFIHVHHIKPIGKIGKQYEVNPKKDLIPVCPNCHAMIHRTEPPLTVEQLRNHLQETQRGA